MNSNDSKLHFLQQAQSHLASAIIKFTSALNDTSFTRYITLLSAIIDYANYLYYLTAASVIDVALLVDPESSMLTDWTTALTAFGITLANDINPADGWDKDSGIRVKEAYKAVWKIINKIADTFAEENNVALNDGYKFKAIVQFFDSFSGTTLKIVSGEDPQNPKIYATTNSTGSVVSLYNQPHVLLPNDISRGYALHTAENLVHEFGHVLDFRTGNDMYETEWQSMRNTFGGFIDCGTMEDPDDRSSLLRGFNVGDGMDIAFRQNKLNLSAFTNCYSPASGDTELCDDPNQTLKDEVCFELEIERIADMFLFWVYSDDSSYSFANNSRGEALSSFANGGAWSRDNINLINKGFIGWIVQVGGTN